MLVATPGQTASYSTLHNNSSSNGGGGGGSNNTTVATSMTKKSSANSTTSNTTKPLNNNNNHASSTVTTKSSLNSNSNTNSTIHNNYHPNTKNDNIVLNKLNNQNKSAAASAREIISSSKKPATAATAATHSLKTENSTNTTTITTKTKQLIQNFADSVQKALILTTDRNSNTNSIAAKQHTTNDNKLQKNCNNSKTSVNKVTSSSSSTSHNANKVSTTTTSSLNTLGNATAATQSSASASVVRGKYFSCSLSKLHTVAPTIIHRYPEERQHASSTDSLHKEMCHFKPIRIVPKTPFKSGSKSRGNSLRFPKANLATKKNEFVLKSNCDANNRKRKQPQNQMQNDKIIAAADEDDENEQENKEFHRIYKPKPSLTCLSTSFHTPNHTSAFVCLIADVKSFVNMQSSNQLAADFVDEPDDTQIIELFRRKREKPTKKQLKDDAVKQTPKTRGYRQSTTKTVAKDIDKQNAKINKISKASKVAITKAKSLRNVGRAKSKTNNMLAPAATTNAKRKLQNIASMPAIAGNEIKAVVASTSSRRTSKRQADEHNNSAELLSTSNKSILPIARKSSRLSARALSVAPANARTRYSANQISTQTTTRYSQKNHKNPETVVRFSPPMTRSRLKHLTEQGKAVATAALPVAKKRKI